MEYINIREAGEWNWTISTTLSWDPKLSHSKLKHNPIYRNFKWSNSIHTDTNSRHRQEKKERESQKHGSMLMLKRQRIFHEQPRSRSYTCAHSAQSGNYETMNLEDHLEGWESVEGDTLCHVLDLKYLQRVHGLKGSAPAWSYWKAIDHLRDKDSTGVFQLLG